MKFFKNNTLIIATVLGALSVVFGAMGAHGLAPYMDQNQVGYFEKAVFYQFIHAVVLLVIGVLLMKETSKHLLKASIAMTIGVLFFSGSLYLFALGQIIPIASIKAILGPITPLGGTAFIIGWIYLLLFAKQVKRRSGAGG